MKINVNHTYKINLDTLKAYMDDLGVDDETPREFFASFVSQYGIQGLDQAVSNALGHAYTIFAD